MAEISSGNVALSSGSLRQVRSQCRLEGLRTEPPRCHPPSRINGKGSVESPSLSLLPNKRILLLKLCSPLSAWDHLSAPSRHPPSSDPQRPGLRRTRRPHSCWVPRASSCRSFVVAGAHLRTGDPIPSVAIPPIPSVALPHLETLGICYTSSYPFYTRSVKYLNEPWLMFREVLKKL